jgi:L-malate glycosyltransferase
MRGGIWLVLDLDAKKRGSMEEQLVALAEHLRSESVAVTMVFAAPPAPFPGESLRRLDVDVRNLDFRSPDAAATLAAWFHEDRPEIVHFHFLEPYSAQVAVAKLSGAAIFVHEHVALTPARSFARSLARRARGLALDWMVDLRVAVSQFVADALSGNGGVRQEKIHVVENGVSLGRFTCHDDGRLRAELGLGDAPLVASVARLDEEKGGRSLIQAMALLESPAHLAMVGEGPCEASWRAFASTLGVAQRVHFLGLRNDVERILAASSVVVVPSEWEEAFGLAVIEGMAASRPVIVTQSGAMPHIVGDAGIVVPKRDPRSLAMAMRTVLSDRLLAQRLGAAGRKRVEHLYSMDRYVDRMVETYRAFLPPRGLDAGRATGSLKVARAS